MTGQQLVMTNTGMHCEHDPPFPQCMPAHFERIGGVWSLRVSFHKTCRILERIGSGQEQACQMGECIQQ